MTRKLPAITADSAPFWQGGESGQLQIHKCAACNRYFHPPAPICPSCCSREVAPQPVSGKGKVLSFTINHQAWRPDLDVPYVVAIVELPEQTGLRFVTNIVGLPPEAVRIDMPVRVRFEQQEDVWLPVFEKDE
ncbi:DNA-binding protein [Parazoarcus communis]|uniref:DNA-binding protein n=1 Tax=Parazoarcus communis TaxID=41977 RepID=A0A2U8GKZ8_9RHOO|nr:OB-fold domain-containing protein [Parazoarcus communis]AWI74241.1 DNA-binding protein [Parazoarcus communis]